jgi:hypothetical protein
MPLAAALWAVLDGIDSVGTAVAEGLDLLDEAISCLDVLTGSTQPEVEQVLGVFAQAQQAGRELGTDLAVTRASVEGILSRVVGLLGDGASTSTDELVRRDTAVDESRQRVGRTPSGSQTRGVWIRGDGTVEELQSGQHTPWFAETYRQLRALGGPAGRALTRLATHIEVQMVLARMGKGEVGDDATLVLSRRPCGSPPDMAEPFTCDSQLANLIRATGRSLKLTIVDPDGKVWVYPKGSTRR